MFLFGMLAVSLDIRDVVEQIHGARNQTKQKESLKRSQKRREREQLLVEDQCKKHEAVLCPLAQAHGFDESFQHAIILPDRSKIHPCPKFVWMYCSSSADLRNHAP